MVIVEVFSFKGYRILTLTYDLNIHEGQIFALYSINVKESRDITITYGILGERIDYRVFSTIIKFEVNIPCTNNCYEPLPFIEMEKSDVSTILMI